MSRNFLLSHMFSLFCWKCSRKRFLNDNVSPWPHVAKVCCDSGTFILLAWSWCSFEMDCSERKTFSTRIVTRLQIRCIQSRVGIIFSTICISKTSRAAMKLLHKKESSNAGVQARPATTSPGLEIFFFRVSPWNILFIFLTSTQSGSGRPFRVSRFCILSEADQWLYKPRYHFEGLAEIYTKWDWQSLTELFPFQTFAYTVFIITFWFINICRIIIILAMLPLGSYVDIHTLGWCFAKFYTLRFLQLTVGAWRSSGVKFKTSLSWQKMDKCSVLRLSQGVMTRRGVKHQVWNAPELTFRSEAGQWGNWDVQGVKL